MSEQMRKACPCCAGDMMVWERHAPNTTWQPIIGYRARCQQCRLSTDDYPTEAEAIAAWNQRAGEAELASLRQEKNEAIGAALAVEQKCYDQAQELAKLRKLREAAQYVCDCWQIDSDNEHAVVPFGPASMLQDMLAAWGRWQRLYVGQDIGGRG